MRSDPSEARIFPRAWVLGIGVRRKGPGIPEGLSARCPDSFAGWIQLDHREGPRSHEINRGVKITFNLCRQQERDHSPSQPGASLNPRACQQEPGTGGEASFISSAAVEQVRDLAASSGVIQSLVESWEACSSSNSYCYKPKLLLNPYKTEYKIPALKVGVKENF